MTVSDANGRVLIVEDQEALADGYAKQLRADYEVLVAYGGREALDLLDRSPDVVLLDRRMPDVSGDEVLEEIERRGLACRVAMVTAVEPDFDIIEMGFDDYLVKPVSVEQLRSVVDRLLSLSRYDDDVRELYALAAKKAALEGAKGGTGLEDDPEYQALLAEIEHVREQAGDSARDLRAADFEVLF